MREWDQNVRGRDDLLGVTAWSLHPSDAVADAEGFNRLAEGQNPSRAFDTWDERERIVAPKHALPHARIHEIHTGHVDLDQDLAWTGEPVRVCPTPGAWLWSSMGIEGGHIWQSAASIDCTKISSIPWSTCLVAAAVA